MYSTTIRNSFVSKQVTFIDQLPLQAIGNPRNQEASSSQTHNIIHVHIDEEAVQTTLAISSLPSGKDLPDPYKVEPNLDTYKPPVPYSQALNRLKPRVMNSMIIY